MPALRTGTTRLSASCLGIAALLASASAVAQTGPTTSPPAAQSTATPETTPPAPAAPDPTVDQARDAFTLGTSLANQGEWPEALRAFERSSTLRAHPVTTYNIAYCERALGHYTRAYKFFRQTLVEHESGTAGKLPDDLLALAKSYSSEVERRLAHVIVRVAQVDATLSVDGRPLELASAPGAPRPVLMAGTRDDRGGEAPPAVSFELLIDPGRHLIVSSRPGAPDKVVSETFESGASRELTLQADTQPAPKPASTSVSLEAPESGSSKKTWAYVSYGVGAAGLVTGSVFGILALGKKSYLDSEGRCNADKVCDEQYQSDIDTAIRDAWIATAGFGVAVIGAGVGTYLLLTSDDKERSANKPRGSARIEPWIGPTMVGARGRF